MYVVRAYFKNHTEHPGIQIGQNAVCFDADTNGTGM
jgi:hypothetical protein